MRHFWSLSWAEAKPLAIRQPGFNQIPEAKEKRRKGCEVNSAMWREAFNNLQEGAERQTREEL